MKVALGMSGGVDSSAAALILKNSGYDVLGITLKLFGESDADAKTVCDKLKIEHRIIDLTELFKKTVISDFISQYQLGATPNPCIVCNEKIKFGAMLEYALSQKAEMTATGHYAVIEKNGDRFLLKKPADISKDQTYVLYGLSQYQLSHTLFPLGNLSKAQVRDIAEENGFVNAKKKDSQDICFVEDGDYAKFIADMTGEVPEKGYFTDINGNILGEHKGLINYTVGQRKGLGIALGKPAFVIEKNTDNKQVVLGDEDCLFKKNVLINNTNFIPFDNISGDIKCLAKLRYRHKEEPCIIHPVSKTQVLIEFEKPQRAPAKGQSAVFYDGDYCLGGGIIEKGY
ncbi:MAG: tRNA 2-thiouridine(34) synthase MnmA [Clostridia bacterium]|nr:tRNA 2-thiouridine(34) synthase MnmA [Clostridia bacterium]